jgi:hypothetical protein
MIVVEQPSETLAPFNLGVRIANADSWLQQAVSQPLMVALTGLIR